MGRVLTARGYMSRFHCDARCVRLLLQAARGSPPAIDIGGDIGALLPSAHAGHANHRVNWTDRGVSRRGIPVGTRSRRGPWRSFESVPHLARRSVQSASAYRRGDHHPHVLARSRYMMHARPAASARVRTRRRPRCGSSNDRQATAPVIGFRQESLGAIRLISPVHAMVRVASCALGSKGAMSPPMSMAAGEPRAAASKRRESRVAMEARPYTLVLSDPPYAMRVGKRQRTHPRGPGRRK